MLPPKLFWVQIFRQDPPVVLKRWKFKGEEYCTYGANLVPVGQPFQASYTEAWLRARRHAVHPVLQFAEKRDDL